MLELGDAYCPTWKVVGVGKAEWCTGKSSALEIGGPGLQSQL